jgi:hypothetical protein
MQLQLLYKVVDNILYVKRPAPFGGDEIIEHGITLPEGTSAEYIRLCFRAWNAGVLIQSAFPWMKPEDREFLISGIRPSEWEDMFGSSWDREDR